MVQETMCYVLHAKWLCINKCTWSCRLSFIHLYVLLISATSVYVDDDTMYLQGLSDILSVVVVMV